MQLNSGNWTIEDNLDCFRSLQLVMGNRNTISGYYNNFYSTFQLLNTATILKGASGIWRFHLQWVWTQATQPKSHQHVSPFMQDTLSLQSAWIKLDRFHGQRRVTWIQVNHEWQTPHKMYESYSIGRAITGNPTRIQHNCGLESHYNNLFLQTQTVEKELTLKVSR